MVARPRPRQPIVVVPVQPVRGRHLRLDPRLRAGQIGEFDHPEPRPVVLQPEQPEALDSAHAVAVAHREHQIDVVAFRRGSVPEVVEDGVNARLVPPGDVGRLAAALMEVARDPEGTICRWKRQLPVPRTMRDVTGDYLALYTGRN